MSAPILSSLTLLRSPRQLACYVTMWRGEARLDVGNPYKKMLSFHPFILMIASFSSRPCNSPGLVAFDVALVVLI